MITKTRTRESDLADLFCLDKTPKSSEIMKQKLVAMAKSVLKRPYHKTKEAKCLVNYTNKSSSAYCPEFDKLIRKLRPNWFVSTSEIMKQKLIKIAKNGIKKPGKTKEGKALCSYTTKSSGCYCPEFDKLIRKLRPDWFASTSEIMKHKLIKMAKNGLKRPYHKTKEAQALVSYTRFVSSAYCPIFNKTIRKLAPSWF
jgi:hypothetical protein